jgi:uracil-DNA glycosylase
MNKETEGQFGKVVWKLLEDKLFPMKSTAQLFNQYHDWDTSVDLPDANEIRKENLLNYLNSFPKKPSILIVGEAAGPWGCRFSGIPFTGEKQLCENSLPFSGRQSSISNPSIKIKQQPPYISLSAKAFWKILGVYHPYFFVWDCIPLHPHRTNEILSVRNPTTDEVLSFRSLLNEIMCIIKPNNIISVGMEAKKVLKKLEVNFYPVRHPSHGGAKIFEADIKRFLLRRKLAPIDSK